MIRLATGLITILLASALNAVFAQTTTTVQAGSIKLSTSQLTPGTTISLTGTWLYKPGYMLAAEEKPESETAVHADKYLPVAVPNMLNRLQCWLDDSADFQKHEDERLRKLGFDTDKAEDGWYRLSFDVPQLPKDTSLFVEFDGVAMKCRTYCNGSLLGDHAGMFSRFSYDLTKHVKPGLNTLAVFVSMEKIPASTTSLGQAVSVNLTESKVKSMSKGMFGPLSPNHDNRAYDLHGIWQPVKFVVRGTAKLHDVWFVPNLAGADVHVEAAGLSAAKQKAFLKATWTDMRTGDLFGTAAPTTVTLTSKVLTTSVTLRNVRPHLWTPSNPILYRLDVTLETEEGKLLDRWSQKVGFRTFEARGNQFYLNGNRYWLRGANHLPYGKNPFDPELPRKLIRLMHDNNQRVTRTHCTPWNEDWITVADEIGLGLSIEGIRPWAFAGKIGATPPDLFKHWLMENEDVVRRCRNHPSVLIWCVGNELLLRDHENVEKWSQLSDVVTQTRKLDPTRPVVCSSSYERKAELYNKVLKPNNIDDGDIDAIHSYKAWYAESPFVEDSIFRQDAEQVKWNRPLIGQEMSTGYSDLDGGIPVRKYLVDLLTPQSWIGIDAYTSAAAHLEHQRAVSKRWAEQLRFRRGERTAGFLLFASECWFYHTYDAATVKPYPVVDAVRMAFAPVGVALDSGRRRFFAGEEISTAIHVVNDDEQFLDYNSLLLYADVLERGTTTVLSTSQVGSVTSLEYYESTSEPVKIRFPETSSTRVLADLVIRVMAGDHEIARTSDPIDIWQKPVPQEKPAPLNLVLDPPDAELKLLFQEMNIFQTLNSPVETNESGKGVIVLGKKGNLDGLTTGGEYHALVSRGATAIVLSPGSKIVEMFAADIQSTRSVVGEFADIAPIVGTSLAEGLDRYDFKWWGRTEDWRVFVASMAYRLRAGGTAKELIHFIPSHGYMSAEKIPDQIMTVLFEIPLGKGRIWVCGLDLEKCFQTDPAARAFTLNLLRAAADPDSTSNVKPFPSHEELLKQTPDAERFIKPVASAPESRKP